MIFKKEEKIVYFYIWVWFLSFEVFKKMYLFDLIAFNTDSSPVYINSK